MNIVQLLEEREQHNGYLQSALENSVEDAFIAGNAEQFDNEMPRAVSSTIAIAMACDGLTFATTHGDHTVKVFDFANGKQIRNFVGHPRTPWTLKYHPVDPNIIASGCLGFQVRVWDIKEDACLNLIIFNQTIISLAFHPRGDYIAVASGMRIEMWEWRVSLEFSHDYPPQPGDTKFFPTSHYLQPESEPDGPHYCRSISHKRNVRAVLFHPTGDYVFAVAPDSPKQNNEDLAHCRLYACEFQALLQVDRVVRWGSLTASTAPSNPSATPTTTPTSGTGDVLPPFYEEDRDNGEGGEIPADDDSYILPLKLTSCRVLIPQVHLYSDGGIDISRDGRYLFTCARVHLPPFFYAEPWGGTPNKSAFSSNTSPNSHPARVVADDSDTNFSKRLPPSLMMPAVPPRRVGQPPVSNMGAAMLPPRPPTPPLFVAMNRRSGAGSNSSAGAAARAGVSAGTNSSAASSRVSSTSSSPLPGSQPAPASSYTHHDTATGKSEGIATDNSDLLPEMMAGLRLSGTKTEDGWPRVIDMIRRKPAPPIPPAGSNRSIASQGVEEGVVQVGDCVMKGAATTEVSTPQMAWRVWSRCDQLESASQRRIEPHQRQKLIRMGDRAPAGWLVEDHLCLFELHFQPNGCIQTPTLLNSKRLPGQLTKAVTSTKLSVTCRYALIGFGVRVGGQVQDHPRKHAACEVVKVGDENMTSVTVMCDVEDEVNIAQFHPFPGHGIVYGTKRGKVRTFCKS